MCGLTNGENLLRLKECLRGEAWRAVYGRLLHPDNVPGAIEALRRRFGKTDRILEATAQQIRNLEPPRLERPLSVVDFALALDNLLATVKACGISDFEHNRPLLKELEKKLPPIMRHNWGGFVKGNPMPTLEEFSRWVNNEADNSNSLMEDYDDRHEKDVSKSRM
uniref:Uncharacterized protein n=1 Tax=Anopheles atroparvus TaxID=41427 RepID=A0A182JCD3_ANOAO